uniref:Uncharacterized protein n=1 Tax=Amphimedon queenslandica TaxID=400682 RepID=A0A1X7TLK5_AMPQE
MNSSIQDISFEISSTPSPHCECSLIVKDNSTVLINEYINSSNRIIEYSLTPFKNYQLAVMLTNLRGNIEDSLYTKIYVSTAFSEAQMYSSTIPVNYPTIDTSQKSSLVLTICLSVIGGVSIILIIIIIAITTLWYKKRQKEKE